MKIKTGCIGFHVAFVVPNNDTIRMESFLETHEKFMRETHFVEGNIEPVVLCYAVFKSPEFNNPLDPESGETGSALYGITEIYNGPEGAGAHMNLGQYCVSGILGAPIIRAME